MDKQQDHVLRILEERDVRSLRLWFTDVIGTLKSVTVAPAELEMAFTEGIGFDGSSIEGFTRVSESDMIVRPDASTFQMMPWLFRHPSATAPSDAHLASPLSGGGYLAGSDGRLGDAPAGFATARMFGDLLTPEGNHAPTDTRGLLRTVLAKAADHGFTVLLHPEVEFYVFEQGWIPGEAPIPVDRAGYFDHVPRGLGHGFRRTAVSVLEEMGIPVEFSHHENGPGQHEIDLRSADALTTADNIMTLRTVVKDVAADHGVYATFMPKPLMDHPGNGMHTHFSLFEGDRNVFFEPGATYQLSTTARRFVAGILRHARDISLVTNQFVNSYKRLWGGGEAPSYVCWGHNNRSALIRVPMYKPGKDSSTRIEYRGLDAAANPYLAYALIIAAGLKGIEERYELPDALGEDVHAFTPAERRALQISPLPSSLDEAIDAMESSDLIADVAGEHIYDFVLRNKRQEWHEYRHQVTAFELRRFLPML